MSLSTSGQISFSQINSALRITNGNLGIGTTAPGFKLDVNGSIKGTSYTGENMSLSGSITSGTIIVNGSVSANTYTGGNMQLSGDITTSSLHSANGILTNYGSGINVADVTNTKMMDIVFQAPRDKTRIYAPGNNAGGNTSKITIQNNGNVGIGTENPREVLEARGNLRIGNSTQANYIAFSGVNGDGENQWNHTYIGERLYNGTDFSELLLFKGNDPASDRIRLLAPEIDFDIYTNFVSGAFNGVATYGTTQMSITSSGSICMGTTRTSAKLNIGGGIDLQGSEPYIAAYGAGPLIIDPNFSSNNYIQMYDEVRLGGDLATNTIFKETNTTMGTTFVRNQLTVGGGDVAILRFDRSGTGRFDFEMGLDGNGEMRFRGGANASGTDLTDYMTIRSNGGISSGNARISTALTSGTVMVNSGTNRALTYAFLRYNGRGTFTNGNFSYSIYSTGRIAATEFNVFSDERIKINIEDINDSSALDTIRQIQPKRYNYIDTITKTEKPVWGFIAQQVKSVLDYSVNTINEYVPNIYSKASVESCTDGSILTLSAGTTNALDMSKAVEENKIQIKLYIDNEEEEEFVKEVYVKEIINGTQIKIDETFMASTNEVFVYGQKVKDFHALNKDAIFTVSVAALQEVDRQLQNTKNRISTRKETINTLKQELQDIASRLVAANL
jgi:hypothetical protein